MWILRYLSVITKLLAEILLNQFTTKNFVKYGETFPPEKGPLELSDVTTINKETSCFSLIKSALDDRSS